MTPIQELTRLDELEAKIASLQSELFAERAMHRRELMNLTKISDVAGTEAAQRECDWRNAALKLGADVTTPAKLVEALEMRARELEARRQDQERSQLNLSDATMLIEQLAKDLGINPVWSRSYNVGRIREEIAKLRVRPDATGELLEADLALAAAGFTGPDTVPARIRKLHEKANAMMTISGS